MEQKTMLVRIGGDVVRRPVAYESFAKDVAGTQHLMRQEPELYEGEMIVQLLSERIPNILKNR